ncbi:hypothetical protein [Methanosarcina horonobensis]|uniref:hypothetical protein n=1 Tax=Methanosarcina horonobensis TaxID=418008 RepID=UPI000A7AB6BE|nr:hypothetical protein [Methanosarcina horonobensis]
MVSDDKSRKSSCFREVAEDRTYAKNTDYKQNRDHKSSSLEASQLNKALEHVQQMQTRQVVDDTPENLLICMEHCGTCPSLPFPPEPLLFLCTGVLFRKSF